MGQYINVNSKGEHLGVSYSDKVRNIIADGGKRVSGDEYLPGMICVVDNGLFGAAGYMYSQKEYEYFRDNTGNDGRSVTWLTHPNAADLVD